MTRGKKLLPPKITIVTAENPKYKSKDEAWQVVGPLLAQIIAKQIMEDRLTELHPTDKPITDQGGSNPL
jgi:hypothetical protein